MLMNISSPTGLHEALIERICAEEPFSNSGLYRQILKHLDNYHADDSKRTLTAICKAIPNDSSSRGRRGNMATTISRLRIDLKHFFTRHPDEAITLDIPDAGNHVYRLQPVESASRLSGAEEFWYPHFQNHSSNLIVFNEPLAFRAFGRKRRLFIRDLDLNEFEFPSDKEQIAELKRRLPWLKHSKVTVSRAYIPGGEVFAKDLVRDWLEEHRDNFAQRKRGRRPLKEVCIQVVSGSWEWSQGPETDAPCLGDSNLIVLGNSRSTSEVRFLQASQEFEVHRYRIEDAGIVIKDATSTEKSILEKRGCKYARHRDSEIVLSEDWSKESLALLTRGRSRETPKIVTLIAANQGRGIHAVASMITNDDKWRSLCRELNLSRPLPAEFQILFHVDLFRETRSTKCTALFKSDQSQG